MYSKRPKSEHVRFSDRGPSFGSKFGSDVQNVWKLNILFGLRTIIYVWKPNDAVRMFGFRHYCHPYAMNAEIRTYYECRNLNVRTNWTFESRTRLVRTIDRSAFGRWLYVPVSNEQKRIWKQLSLDRKLLLPWAVPKFLQSATSSFSSRSTCSTDAS